MREWAEAPLGSLASIEIGGTPARAVSEYWARREDEGNPWVSIADLGPRIVFDTKEQITDLGIRNSNVKRVPAGALMMSFKLTIGRAGIAGRDLYTNEAIAAFLPLDGRLDGRLLYYILPGVASNAITDTAVKGVTLNKQKLRELRIKFPENADEQQRIAEVLSTIDEAIEQTEALIAKTQQIKAGLMEDLFTRGVTADGQLRRPREEAPQLYKESPLGWIPEAWDIRTLRACLLDSPTNGIYKPAHLIGTGTLLVGQAAFTAERSIDFSLARRAVVSSEELRRYEIAADNILLSRVFATIEGVGRPTLVPPLPEPAVYESNMMRLRVDRNAIRPRLLFEWLRGRHARQRIEGGVNASNQASVNQGVLNPLPVLWQPPEEQDRLVGVIEGHDKNHAAERATLDKLRSLRHGLMNDLLTGRVRVPVAGAQKVAANV